MGRAKNMSLMNKNTYLECRMHAIQPACYKAHATYQRHVELGLFLDQSKIDEFSGCMHNENYAVDFMYCHKPFLWAHHRDRDC